MKDLFEHEGNPTYNIGDRVTVVKNEDCRFEWIDDMDEYVSGEYEVEYVCWDEIHSCYAYRLKDCDFTFDANCLKTLINERDFDDVDNTEIDKFLSMFCRNN